MLQHLQMSASMTTNVSDLYAVVDLSKKKSIQSTDMYAEVDLSEKKAKQPTKRSSNNCCSSEFDVLQQDIMISEKMNKNINTKSQEQNNGKDNHAKLESFFDQNINKIIWIFAALVIFICITLVIILFTVLYQKVSSLEAETHNLHNISTTFENHSSSIYSVMNFVHEVQLNRSPINDYFLSSCLEIANLNYTYLSGRYIVRSPNGVLRSIYCDFNRTFGGNSTGWMRVAKLDADNCPVGFSTKTFANSSLACSVSMHSLTCTKFSAPVYKMQYTQISGRVRGYQKGSLDCFKEIVESGVRRPSSNSDISSNYLDGVSITSNGEHVWSFAAGCQCNNVPNKPNFVGDHFTTDGLTVMRNNMFNANLLWGSQKCNTMSNWFHRILPSTNTDIMIQVCQDQQLNDEEIAIAEIEIYVQ